MKIRKKLIEVALPLEAINAASAREKSIRHGHPSTLHLWWARRPLAAARAVIFAQMVDDPCEYVPELLGDPKLKRKAESELKARRATWLEAQAAHEKATAEGAQAPEPGPEPTLETVLADQERQRLFGIIEELVKWENTTNERVLQAARDEIWQSWRRTCAENADHPRAKELFDRNKLPAFHDPFAGGGALPLEAQRLGLESYASDLNPVAVIINKAMIEIPPKFAGRPPVNPEWQSLPEAQKALRQWKGAQGLAEDVRYYGKWMRDEAEKRIGHLYPNVEVTEEMVIGLPGHPETARPDLKPYLGKKLTVIAWLWARTVKSPNPAFAHTDVPLASTFILSSKPGTEAFVEPIVEGDTYRFTVRSGKPKDKEGAENGTKLGRGANFRCVISAGPIPSEHIYGEAQAGRLGARLMAIVAEGDRGRVYLSPVEEHEAIAREAKASWKPEVEMPANPRWFSPPLYGLKTYGDLFTDRQLVALNTFSNLIAESREQVLRDSQGGSLPIGANSQSSDGIQIYVTDFCTYLGLIVSRSVDRHNTICSWDMGPSSSKSSTGSPARSASIRNAFARQALPMTWDFAEGNPFSESATNFEDAANWIAKVLDRLEPRAAGCAVQSDASAQNISLAKIVSTDPPYFDNIGYADLSDFFYVWLRHGLRDQYSELFATMSVPKDEELVATPYRHGGKEAAGAFFLSGMTKAMHQIAAQSHRAFPTTIYYAFKQSETAAAEGTTSTGWETFLGAVIDAGFSISGTWPMRTELSNRMIGSGTNALASSIVLVCRKRPEDAPTATRREFVQALEAELAPALRNLQAGNIAPVDLAQAAIGPGMAVFTRYAKVVDAEGHALSVKQALALINEKLDTVLAEQEGDFDSDTRWALAWFEQTGFAEGEYGIAETLSKAKNTSVHGMVDAGILKSGTGKVRLLKPDELTSDWNPDTDKRLTTWEIVHHLVRVLEAHGESSAAEVAARLGAKAEAARELAYRLYTICERKKRAQEALSYNGLVQSWPEIQRLAQQTATTTTQPSQGGLFN